MVKYSKWALQLRRDLSDYLLCGCFMDEQRAEIEVDESIIYGVHINRKNDKRAIVVMNVSETDRKVPCDVPSEESKKYLLYQPFREPSEITFPRKLAIGPERVVVLVEE